MDNVQDVNRVLERLAKELNKLEEKLNKCSQATIRIKENLVKMGMKNE